MLVARILPAGRERKYRVLPRSSYDKNSRNSGDFRLAVCFPFITVCRRSHSGIGKIRRCFLRIIRRCRYMEKFTRPRGL